MLEPWMLIIPIVVIGILVLYAALKPRRPDPDELLEIILLAAIDNVVHRHKCPNCSTVWSHTAAQAMREPHSHDCPACGTKQYLKYFGP